MYRFRNLFYSVIGAFLILPSLVFSADLEWKGLYQASHYWVYEDLTIMLPNDNGDIVDMANYYTAAGGDTFDVMTKYMVELTPVIRIADGLRFESTISFSRLWLDEESISDSRYMDGNRYKGRPRAGQDTSLGAELMRFYGVADFENVSVYVGRMPYNFGLGMTYSDGLSYKALTYNVHDVLGFETKFDDFYVKPALSFVDPNGHNKVDLVFEAGYETEDYGFAVLLDESIYGDSEGNRRSKGTNYLAEYIDGSHDQTYRPGTLNVYGHYKVNEDLSVAAEAGIYLDRYNSGLLYRYDDPATESVENELQYGAIVDIFWETGISNSFVNVLAGYATSDYDLNPNWTPVNLLLDYRMYSNASTDEERVKFGSMGFTNGVAVTGIVGERLNDKNNLSLLYAFMNDNMHEVLLIHTFKTNTGFYWDNFLGFTLIGQNGDISFNEVPILEAMTRLAYVF